MYISGSPSIRQWTARSSSGAPKHPWDPPTESEQTRCIIATLWHDFRILPPGFPNYIIRYPPINMTSFVGMETIPINLPHTTFIRSWGVSWYIPFLHFNVNVRLIIDSLPPLWVFFFLPIGVIVFPFRSDNAVSISLLSWIPFSYLPVRPPPRWFYANPLAPSTESPFLVETSNILHYPMHTQSTQFHLSLSQIKCRILQIYVGLKFQHAPPPISSVCISGTACFSVQFSFLFPWLCSFFFVCFVNLLRSSSIFRYWY